MKILIIALVTSALVGACSNNGGNTAALQSKIDSLETELKKFTDDQALTEMRLARFDSLDFEFYSKQDWQGFSISHADDIKVVYPDGNVTEGLYPQHIDMLTPMFAFAPDTKIKNHPVRFGRGDWTCVIGEMEGTFSRPMDVGNQKSIAPTQKKFKLSMATVGQWKDGKMIAEYLFWDNQSFMKQIGLAQ